jgi:hypothetical protein
MVYPKTMTFDQAIQPYPPNLRDKGAKMNDPADNPAIPAEI